MLPIFGEDLPSSAKPLWKILTDKVNSKPVESKDLLPHLEILTKMGIGFSKCEQEFKVLLMGSIEPASSRTT